MEQRHGSANTTPIQQSCDTRNDIILHFLCIFNSNVYCQCLIFYINFNLRELSVWTHTDSSFIFLDSRNDALVMLFITGVYSEDCLMNIFQDIIFCLMMSILPLTWIYSLIKWILGGCRILLSKFKDVTICECDNDVNLEDLAVLRQMLDEFTMKIEQK